MTAVQRPLVGRQREIFASVFPPGSVRPTPNPQRFESKAKATAERIHDQLLTDSRSALGIDDESFTFGAGDGENVLYSYYPVCPPVEFKESLHSDDKLQNNRRSLKSHRLVQEWRASIGPLRLKKIFARILDKLLTEFIEWSYAGVYDDGVLAHLRMWTEHVFATWIRLFLRSIDPASQDRSGSESFMESTRWHEMATTRLATLRVNELFEIVVEWDASATGIDDIKHYTTNPATRSYVTANFTDLLTTRLLHPGASTIEILQVYISIIRAFRRLDPKGVLLERVARKLRRYLRDREDTIKVVVTGLLSDVGDRNGTQNAADPDTLTELAFELQQRDASQNQSANNELDWNNMEWQPDPIDAAPDYMKSMNTDVVGSIISLFESKDIFVKELQTSLAERLLRNKPDYDQEISVVEHLKIRFGDSALQACEVMLRDVLDSRKLDQVIRQDQGLDIVNFQGGEDGEDDIAMHAKILSRLFWPALPEQPFKAPFPILEQRSRYEKGFENLKQTRKLTWNDAIGQVEVELELQDRTWRDEVLPYQATVIYAFQDDASTPDKPVSRTITDLAAELEMSQTLVRSACMFWLSKQILTRPSPSTHPERFSVLESLPPTTSPNASSLSANKANVTASGGSATSPSLTREQIEAESSALSALKAVEEQERKQKMVMYHQLILAMLQNQGSMPLPRIAMMLGIVVPGGFPFSNEELKESLVGMVREGTLTVGAGGNYAIVK